MTSAMYNQAMKWQKKHSKGTRQPIIFSTLRDNERRSSPRLGGSWYEEGRDEERAEFIRKWKQETKRMLEENPDLVIV